MFEKTYDLFANSRICSKAEKNPGTKCRYPDNNVELIK